MPQLDLELLITTSTEMEVALERHATWMKAQGLAETTRETYGEHLERLGDYLAKQGVYRPRDIKRWMLEAWIAARRETWAATTVKQAIAAIRSFVAWSEDSGWISKKKKRKLFRCLKYPRVTRDVQRTLNMEEIEAMLAACPETKKGARDRALVSLLTDTGLRAAEARRLRVDDLEFEAALCPEARVNRLKVMVKGGKVRYGYFGARTAELLKKWLAVRKTIVADDTPEVFVSAGGLTPGHALTRDGLKVILRKLGDSAGVKGVSPHPFRRAFACILAMAGASTRTIQELGRWESMEMVLLYTADYEAARQYNQFAPMDFSLRLRVPDE